MKIVVKVVFCLLKDWNGGGWGCCLNNAPMHGFGSWDINQGIQIKNKNPWVIFVETIITRQTLMKKHTRKCTSIKIKIAYSFSFLKDKQFLLMPSFKHKSFAWIIRKLIKITKKVVSERYSARPILGPVTFR